jgi:hypothetical protein
MFIKRGDERLGQGYIQPPQYSHAPAGAAPPGARHEQRAASALRKRIDFMFASLICGFPGSPGRIRRAACACAGAAVIGTG